MLERCEVDARGGYGKQTALMMRECTPELAEWLLQRGLDVNAMDDYGKTALHVAARTVFEPKISVAWLLEAGADVHQKGSNGITALHAAADSPNAPAVRELLAAGADVHAVERSGLNALEYALQRLSNVGLVRMVPVAELLLEAGAPRSDKAKEFVAKAGERFEFHRAGFNADLVDETSAALQRLCELFEVQPPARREMHDGKSPIVAKGTRWQDQHAYLWDFLVPSSGACATVQGEVVRIAGRVTHELMGNGGINWDHDFREMLNTFIDFIASKNADADDVAQARAVAKVLPKQIDESAHLRRIAVRWVAMNPEPIELEAVSYDR